tara:strand:+ start:81 stop:683 length:603 start_codon:yes stop_codon:yes gene_type:complete
MNVFEYMQFTTKISLIKIKNNLSEKNLTESEIRALNSIKNTKRRNEFVSTRNLRTHLFGKKTIKYNEFGAPYLKNSSIHISISHSNEYVGIAWSEKHPVGMDIENIDRDLSSIQNKFMNSDEKKMISLHKNENIPLMIWCIKESLYKLNKSKGLDFLKNLSCKKLNNGLWQGNIQNEKSKCHLFSVQNFQNHIICFNIEQ